LVSVLVLVVVLLWDCLIVVTIKLVREAIDSTSDLLLLCLQEGDGVLVYLLLRVQSVLLLFNSKLLLLLIVLKDCKLPTLLLQNEVVLADVGFKSHLLLARLVT